MGLKNPKIIIRKILKKSRVRIDGFEYLLNGKTSEAISLESAVQKFLVLMNQENLKQYLTQLINQKNTKKIYLKIWIEKC